MGREVGATLNFMAVVCRSALVSTETRGVKTLKKSVHARLGKHERVLVEQLKTATGLSESELVRRGLRAFAREQQRRSALELAGASVGRFERAPRDLSTKRTRLDGFGE
jgi:hypothetical protein